jgi:hypothetical protein
MTDMDDKLSFFKENGYVIFEDVFDHDLMQAWVDKYDELVERHTAPGKEPVTWLESITEDEPELMLPAVANPTLLDFSEKVMGPFVQLDTLTFFNFLPVPREEGVGQATGWHRDRWAWLPEGPQYIKPNGCNAIVYLQDLTNERGPLRLVPGSHRTDTTLPEKQRKEPHPDEQLIYPRAGDVVFTHCSLFHSGTPNISDDPRHFLSIYYNLSWLKHKDDHSGPNVQKIIDDARRREDRRIQRLFGVDNQLFWRVNSGHALPDAEMWLKWLQEDRAVLTEEFIMPAHP